MPPAAASRAEQPADDWDSSGAQVVLMSDQLLMRDAVRTALWRRRARSRGRDELLTTARSPGQPLRQSQVSQ